MLHGIEYRQSVSVINADVCLHYTLTFSLGPIAITDDDLSRAGKPILPSLAKVKDDGRYIAELEVVHQLHCLVPYRVIDSMSSTN